MNLRWEPAENVCNVLPDALKDRLWYRLGIRPVLTPQDKPAIIELATEGVAGAAELLGLINSHRAVRLWLE